jgi:hypothetical protein
MIIRIPYSQPEMLACIVARLNEEGVNDAEVEIRGSEFIITIHP